MQVVHGSGEMGPVGFCRIFYLFTVLYSRYIHPRFLSLNSVSLPSSFVLLFLKTATTTNPEELIKAYYALFSDLIFRSRDPRYGAQQLLDCISIKLCWFGFVLQVKKTSGACCNTWSK